ncbi:uncharacterized protein LOC117172852 isoform X1 [Belonocnema kinseyi]|uniref:uncharacterized protein LOC117172852 isoform X1 n=1 Tax=Belonocnema kinseyi TaxID=2817044 RepID=UPI00143D4A32|nr:uncharacterized protein LOC117172852 isoform X1 [Belonocnema kinseyi]
METSSADDICNVDKKKLKLSFFRSNKTPMIREKKYALVEFPTKIAEQQPVVDLILSSWIIENTQTCFYPKRKDYSEINNWIQEDKNPDDSWLKNQKIKIIKKYRSLEKAKRGLNKYLLTLKAGDTTETFFSENHEESEP